MAHKTFISYKYNEAQDTREHILKVPLGKMPSTTEAK